MSHICPDCHQHLRAETQGTNVKRINGELVFTSTMTLVTCDTHGCKRNGVTREISAFYAMSESEVDSYHRVGV